MDVDLATTRQGDVPLFCQVCWMAMRATRSVWSLQWRRWLSSCATTPTTPEAPPPIFIADSGLYSAENVARLSSAGVRWINRVPDTSTAAKAALQVADAAWQQDGDVCWALVPQAPAGERWVVVRTTPGEQLALCRPRKRKRVYPITQVDRVTRCIIAYDVAYDREPQRLQALLNTAPSASKYYSVQHEALPNKRQTSSVEGDNADLRHYLARLVRHSRCFTRSLPALRDAVKLFLYAWNRRQLYRRNHPKYAAHVIQFVYP